MGRKNSPAGKNMSGCFFLLCCRSGKGFTLIETLVSFMVLSVSLVIVMQLFSGGLKSGALSTDYMYGIYHAREVTEELLLNEALMPGILSGEFKDGYQWEAVIAPALPEGEEADAPESLLLDISVTVKWMSGSREKRFVIHTNKIAGSADGFVDVASSG